jgi:hypothetical protein
VADKIEIVLTQGNINNNHVYLSEHLDFFPSDAVGALASEMGEGRALTLHVHGLSEPVETDIAGDKRFFRKRGFWKDFFVSHELRAGDTIRITKRSPYEYVIEPRGNGR